MLQVLCALFIACAGAMLFSGMALADTVELTIAEDGGDVSDEPAETPESDQLQAPSNVRLYVQEGGLKIAWDPVEGATGYRVYKRSALGTFAQVGSDIQGTRNTLFRDASVGPSASYRYVITALRSYEDDDDISQIDESGRSVEVVGSPELGTPLIYGMEDDRLTWRPVSYASAYDVYEKAPDKDWELLGSTTGASLSIAFHADCHYAVQARRGEKKSDIDDTFSYEQHRFRSNSVLILGDSLASGDYCFTYRAMRLLGATYSTSNLAGSWMAFNPGTEEKSIYTRAQNLDFSDRDVVIIVAGTNDYLYSVEIGDPESLDESTFYGGCQAVIELIRQQNPECRIVLCEPTESLFGFRQDKTITGSAMTMPNLCGNTIEDYRAALETIADKYGCAIYDLGSTGDMATQSIFANTTDNLHPTGTTHRRIGDDFADFLVQNDIVRAPEGELCQVKNVWVSKHETGAVTFKWTATDDDTVTGWSIRYRTRVIGGDNKWSAWTVEDKTDTVRTAKLAVETDNCIEFAVRHEGDTTWTRSVFTCPAGGRYQAPKSAFVKKGGKRISTLTLQVGKSVKLSPDPEYSVKDYKKRPRLYWNHGFWTLGDASLLEVTGTAGISGMKIGDVTITGLEPGETTLKFETCNGRSCVITVNVVEGTRYRIG